MVKEINQLTKLLKQQIETIKVLTWSPLKDWTFATQNNDINLGFEAFLQLFNTTFDKHAPIKEFTKKEKEIKTMGYQRNKKIYVS